jgi:hypothetical protein
MTPEQIDDEVLRRSFVAIATADYRDPRLPNLPQVREEVRDLAAWFCDEGLGDRRFKHEYPELADNPTEDQIRAALKKPGRKWQEADAVVVYITGHAISERDGHWLAMQTTDKDAYKSTALRTADIIGWLTDTDLKHLLLIIDTCYAGDVAGAIAAFPDQLPETWLVLASAEKNQRAMPFLLTGAIRKVVAELGFVTGERVATGAKYGRDRYLPVREFCGGVYEKLDDSQRPILLEGGLQSGFHGCLPNPHYRPRDTVETQSSRSDLALPKKDLEIHWEPRSRGAPKASALGWLFTGRVGLMDQLIKATQDLPGTVLVTGRAGSGKSAALARLVTLSDPEFRRRYAGKVALVPGELMPPEGAVDVAVLATGKSAAEIMAQICHAVGALDETTAPGPSLDWEGWLRRGTRLVTIVIDALDEADGAPEDLVKVLRQLAGLESDAQGPLPRRVRLIVGVRSVGTSGRGDTAPDTRTGKELADLVQEELHIGAQERIRVDEAPWWARRDVIDYFTSLLLLSAEPYRKADTAKVSEIAEIVADAAGRSFLFANMAAQQLMTRDAVVDVNDPEWRASLRHGVLGLFRDDLRRTLTDPDDRLRAVHLLRAVAFAFGPGLPWRNIWPLVASEVADSPGRYGDQDIVWLLRTRLGGYLVTDRADDTTVYRLFHDDLRNILYERWEELLEPVPEENG